MKKIDFKKLQIARLNKKAMYIYGGDPLNLGSLTNDTKDDDTKSDYTNNDDNDGRPNTTLHQVSIVCSG